MTTPIRLIPLLLVISWWLVFSPVVESQVKVTPYSVSKVDGTGAFSGQLQGPTADNCAALPYSFVSDLDTGMCSPGAGTLRFIIDAGTYLTLGSSVVNVAQDILLIGGTSRIANSADGVIRLQNNAATDFGRLQFGGTTASFPALKRATTNLEVKLADDSAYSGVKAQTFIGDAVLFVNLGTPVNGTFVYCSDCTIANPCAGSGTGALAKRLNGAWVCN